MAEPEPQEMKIFDVSSRYPPNMVTSPPHYKDAARVECITIIEDLGLTYNLGNALKYLWRKGRKDPAKTLEDLQKARFYVDREIALLGAPSWNPDEAAPLGKGRV